MLNQVILVGTVYQGIQEETKEGITSKVLKLAVKQVLKNEYGEYPEDILTVYLPDNLAEKIVMAKLGKKFTVGIKARLTQNKTLQIIAERVTFIGTKDEE